MVTCRHRPGVRMYTAGLNRFNKEKPLEMGCSVGESSVCQVSKGTLFLPVFPAVGIPAFTRAPPHWGPSSSRSQAKR